MKGILIRGFETGELLEMIYMAKDNAISQRKIKILQINNTYIRAYCYLKNQIRIFKLENILSVSPTIKRGA
ncbi:WYL domain-containing protein [Bacillus testis]|uniref:hypothetical protein n=1 Tax=Bacillus testis TaxID=1622072 RepID=UPI00067F3E7D|nr:hypothetical protein [Bacillus testis]